jgi:hypothetical protein
MDDIVVPLQLFDFLFFSSPSKIPATLYLFLILKILTLRQFLPA